MWLSGLGVWLPASLPWATWLDLSFILNQEIIIHTKWANKKKQSTRIPETGPVNVYVGNLGPTVLEQDLRDLFSAFGQVNSVRIISDRETGESKGYGFVEIAKPADAEQALSALNGKDLKGQDIKASVSKPKRRSDSRNRRYWYGFYKTINTKGYYLFCNGLYPFLLHQQQISETKWTDLIIEMESCL